ncbi:hypothetical protein F5Y16DRAFT_319511 [Xylariaceae sp. FL0255]|nr:hypothetical protein F5Y16DRAFT_319511 [Xylariaceae sp. FL0255]
MPPRRSHKKSRAGCKRCKARKIKCDEVHPRCGNCSKHGVPCDFQHPSIGDALTPAPPPTTGETPRPISSPSATTSAPPSVSHGASPTNSTDRTTPAASANTPAANNPRLFRNPDPPPISSAPKTNRMMELRLFHHYTTVTCQTLAISSPVAERIWRETVPNLAFSSASYLTDALLAVAALHLRSMSPGDRDVVRASHSYMASTLSDYGASLRKGITETNAEALFLTAALIAFHSTASRIFARDDAANETPGVYTLPMSWFHSFQGVKAVVAASWLWLRNSAVVIHIIESQPALNLDLSAHVTFFADLMVGVEEEIAKIDDPATQLATRMAYQHAVAVLDWAHKIPHTGAPLVFLATVSRRFVELLETRTPRALAILASYFALLKCLGDIWWLRGVARREIMGIVSLFSPDDEEWWPRLQWPLRIALHDEDVIPPHIWGADFLAETNVLETEGQSRGVVSHIELISDMLSSVPQNDGSAPDLDPAHQSVLEQEDTMREQMLLPDELEMEPLD